MWQYIEKERKKKKEETTEEQEYDRVLPIRLVQPVSVVLKYEMGNFWRNGQFLGERGRNGQLLGEMGMINRVMT